MKTAAEILDDVDELYQVVSSVEADFEKRTWTFHGAFKCTPGNYVVIHQSDFDQWRATLRDALNGTGAT